MARIRSVKPEFFTSLTIAGLPVEARLTFIGLWTHVDDAGRCVDDARLIKAAVWPLDDRTAADVETDLTLLTESSLITRYTVGERSYLAVRGWDEHQRVNRRTPSKLPPPPPADKPAGGAPTPGLTSGDEPSLSPHAPIADDSLRARKEQGAGKGAGNRENRQASPAAAPDGGGGALTPTQRSKRVTDAYAAAQPMCRWPAVNAVALRAIKTGRYADREIEDALLRLASDGRPVTVETLRVELEGLPPPRASPTNGHRPSTTDQRVAGALAIARRLQEEETRDAS